MTSAHLTNAMDDRCYELERLHGRIGARHCPCHGSRFDCRGKVINGPANLDLASAERPENKRAA